MRLKDCYRTADFRKLAKRRLPAPIFHYIDGGSDDELTLQRNTSAYDSVDLVPNVLTGADEVDMSVEVLGARLSMPLFFAPTALQRLFHHDGERAIARAAGNFGTMFCVSTLGTRSIEELAALTDAPKYGKFVWHDLITDDPAAARDFYSGLLGWSFERANRPSGGSYTLILSEQGRYVGGLGLGDALLDILRRMDTAGHEKSGNGKIRRPQFDMFLQKRAVQAPGQMKNPGQVFRGFFIDRHTGAQRQTIRCDGKSAAEDRVAKRNLNLIAIGRHFRRCISLVPHKDHPAPAGFGIVILGKPVSTHIPVKNEHPHFGVKVERPKGVFNGALATNA